jgi:DNA-binding CsgD family transcriptional regulator
VEKHVERLRDKTAAGSREELARVAAKYGVVPA